VGISGYDAYQIDTVATAEDIAWKPTPGKTAAQQHTDDLDWIMKAVDRRKCSVKLDGATCF